MICYVKDFPYNLYITKDAFQLLSQSIPYQLDEKDVKEKLIRLADIVYEKKMEYPFNCIINYDILNISQSNKWYSYDLLINILIYHNGL